MNDTQDHLLTYPQYARLCIREAFAEKDDGSKPTTEETLLHLANAVFTLSAALEELQATPLEPPKAAKPSKQKKAQPQQAAPSSLLARWRALPYPSYVFLKTAGLAMLQELSNSLRRA